MGIIILMNLVTFLPQEVFHFVFLLARLGSLIMVLPGFNEGYFNARGRVAFAAIFALVLLPVIPAPPLPNGAFALFFIVLGEILVGLFMGLMAKFIVAALDTAGTIMGLQSGLANVIMFNPAMAQQTGVLSVFLMMVGMAIIFVSNLHHLALAAIVDSYTLMPSGVAVPIGDMSDFLSHMLSKSFALGMQISAPLLVIGVVFNVGMGLLARLMPQLQIFFLATPVQLLLGFFTMMIGLQAGMHVFAESYQQQLMSFMTVGVE
jgi:flagellar biosynthetic protein FliR